MPPKIRDLIQQLEAAGYRNRGGRGSHRNFVHEKALKPVTISGNSGEDAKFYQIKAVQQAIKEVKS